MNIKGLKAEEKRSVDCNTLNAIAGSLRHMGYDELSNALITIQKHLSEKEEETP